MVDRRGFLKGATVAGLSGLAGCIGGVGGGGGTGTIKLGMLAPFSGGYGFYGRGQRKGVELDVELVNASDEMLPNTEIELVVGDTKTDPEVGLSATRELVIQEGVDHLLGTTSSAVANAVRNFVKDRELTFTIMNAASAYLTSGENCNRHVFRDHAHTGIFGEAWGAWATETLGTDAYVLFQDYTYGYSLRDHAIKGIEEAGGTVVGRAAMPLGANQFGGVIDEITTLDPDWLFMGMVGTGGVPFFTQAASRGLSVPCAGMPSPPEMGKLTTQQFERLPDIYNPASFWLPQLDNPGNQRFMEEFQAMHGDAPTDPAHFGYATSQLVTHMLDEAGGADATLDDVIAAGEGLTFMSPRGEITVRACDHQGSHPMFVQKLVSVEGEGSAELELIETIDGAQYQDDCDAIDCRFE